MGFGEKYLQLIHTGGKWQHFGTRNVILEDFCQCLLLFIYIWWRKHFHQAIQRHLEIFNTFIYDYFIRSENVIKIKYKMNHFSAEIRFLGFCLQKRSQRIKRSFTFPIRKQVLLLGFWSRRVCVLLWQWFGTGSRTRSPSHKRWAGLRTALQKVLVASWRTAAFLLHLSQIFLSRDCYTGWQSKYRGNM